MLRFFKIGFFWRKEFDFEIWLLSHVEELGIHDLSDPVCNGPYNHVTSQSFSLVNVSKVPFGWDQYVSACLNTYQFKVSGDTVFSLFFALTHVRHEAFSSLALLL